MKNIFKYINNNKIYFIILLIGIALLGIQLNQVIMYADDYSLGIHSNENGFVGAFDYFIYNYLHWGGGFTGFIVICILTIGFKAWMVIELLLILAIILITIRFIHLKDGKYKIVTAIMVWLLFFIISISVSRETILWLDGSMAYVLTTFQVIFYLYLIYTRIYYPKMRKKYDYVLFPLAAFFGGWSAAQSGAVVVLLTIIIWLFAKYVNKIKIPKFYLYSSILTLVGYCIFFFAPGNSERMTYQGLFATLDFFSKIQYKVNDLYGVFFDYKTYSFFGLPFYTYFVIVLLLIVTNHFLKKEKNDKTKLLLTLTCVYNSVFLSLVVLIGIQPGLLDLSIEKILIYKDIYQEIIGNTFTFKCLIPYVIATITVISTLIQTIYLSLKNKNPLLLLLLLSGIAAQGIMLMAPGHPYRTTLITIIIFIIVIAYLFKYILDNDLTWEYLVPVVFMINYFSIGFTLFITFLATRYYFNDNKLIKLKTFNITIFLILLSLLAAYNWGMETKNYRENKEIDNQNMIRIEEYKEHPAKNKILVLVAPEDSKYGFTPLAGADWIEKSVKIYFEIDPETDLMFEEEYETYLKEKNKEE